MLFVSVGRFQENCFTCVDIWNQNADLIQVGGEDILVYTVLCVRALIEFGDLQDVLL